MTTIGKFFARIRRENFAAKITREIYQKIFPHMNGHADHGYPFSSDDELFKARIQGFVNLRRMLCAIDLASRQMPEAEGQAFLYIVQRDLEEQMRRYLKFANARKTTSQSEELHSAAATA